MFNNLAAGTRKAKRDRRRRVAQTDRVQRLGRGHDVGRKFTTQSGRAADIGKQGLHQFIGRAAVHRDNLQAQEISMGGVGRDDEQAFLEPGHAKRDCVQVNPPADAAKIGVAVPSKRHGVGGAHLKGRPVQVDSIAIKSVELTGEGGAGSRAEAAIDREKEPQLADILMIGLGLVLWRCESLRRRAPQRRIQPERAEAEKQDDDPQSPKDQFEPQGRPALLLRPDRRHEPISPVVAVGGLRSGTHP